jgi:Calcium-binding EGF domain
VIYCFVLNISVNTIGAFQCICNEGYFRNNAGDCEDVDECLQTNPSVCKTPSEKCVNYDGGYACQCAVGYNDTNPSDGTLACADIDECRSFPFPCKNKQTWYVFILMTNNR